MSYAVLCAYGSMYICVVPYVVLYACGFQIYDMLCYVYGLQKCVLRCAVCLCTSDV